MLGRRSIRIEVEYVRTYRVTARSTTLGRLVTYVGGVETKDAALHQAYLHWRREAEHVGPCGTPLNVTRVRIRRVYTVPFGAALVTPPLGSSFGRR